MCAYVMWLLTGRRDRVCAHTQASALPLGHGALRK